MNNDQPWYRSSWLRGLAILLFLFWFIFAIQFSTESPAGTDGYFHIKLARLYWEGGPIRGEFPWMRHTLLEKNFIDHHLVLHLLQAPFTALFPLHKAAKVSAAFFGALAIFSFYLLLRLSKIAYAEGWVLLLAGASYPFLYRMNMPRAQAIGVILFCLFLAAWKTRSHRLLFAVVLFFTWAYQLCILLLPMAILLSLAAYWIDGEKPFGALKATVGGLGLGHIVNFYFPTNLYFMYLHVGIVALNKAHLRAGSEWKPYNSWFIVTSSWPTWVAIFAVVSLFFLARQTKPSARTVGLFFLMALFYFLLVKNRRWMEYWPLFSLLFAASSVDDLVRGHFGRVPKLPWWLLLVIGLGLGGLLFVNGRRAAKDISSCSSWKRYRGAARWLQENTKEGEVVYTTDWDDLPELFFHNHHNHYMLGLDPHFMYLHDKDLYYLWDRINRGLIVNPSEFIKRTFGATYVFTDRGHGDFKNQAKKDPAFTKVYKDKHCSIYRIDDEGIVPDTLTHEAELCLPLHGSSGQKVDRLNLREIFGIDCSNSQTVLYRAGKKGDWAEWSFQVSRTGKYMIAVNQVMAPDYGIIKIAIDGVQVGSTYDGYSPYVAIRSPRLPTVFQLEKGTHRFRMTVHSRNEKSRGHFFGLDSIELLPME